MSCGLAPVGAGPHGYGPAWRASDEPVAGLSASLDHDPKVRAGQSDGNTPFVREFRRASLLRIAKASSWKSGLDRCRAHICFIQRAPRQNPWPALL